MSLEAEKVLWHRYGINPYFPLSTTVYLLQLTIRFHIGLNISPVLTHTFECLITLFNKQAVLYVTRRKEEYIYI